MGGFDLTFIRWKWRWLLVLLVSVLAIVLIFLASIIGDPNDQSRFATALRDMTATGPLKPPMDIAIWATRNSILSGVLLSFFTSLISVSVIYLFKIPEIRKTSIRAIAFGYYENFLRKLVTYCNENHRVYRIVIVMPTYELVTQPDVYWNILKERVRRMGFRVATQESDASFGRTAFFIEKLDNPPLPLFIDIPTTTRTLQEVLELEADMRVGKGRVDKWFRARFKQLRDEFAVAIRVYYPEFALRSLVFIAPETQEEFETEMARIIGELETDIGGGDGADA